MADDNLPVSTPSEIDLAKQQDEHQYKFAVQQMEANLQNQREQREHLKFITVKNNRAALILFITGMLCLLVFGLAALYLNKEAILSDLLKIAAGFAGGGGLGFYYGWNKRARNPHS